LPDRFNVIVKLALVPMSGQIEMYAALSVNDEIICAVENLEHRNI
jgi:hypothetical protein